MAKLSNKSAAGTSFHGHTVTATPNQLIEALGEPQFGCNDGQDALLSSNGFCKNMQSHLCII